eukprot:comp23898_c0_seq3/m.42027 comp23898_c0_seq3/g.42027  ORF comp23898_c0_seq3/g.42027 comp23898_c0_seq3/m.42027 type:complete len:469 (-) comp23898_c0_seq3:545-1951(-)
MASTPTIAPTTVPPGTAKNEGHGPRKVVQAVSAGLASAGKGLQAAAGRVVSPMLSRSASGVDENAREPVPAQTSPQDSGAEDPDTSSNEGPKEKVQTKTSIGKKVIDAPVAVKTAVLKKLGMGQYKASQKGVEEVAEVSAEQKMFETFSVWLQAQKLKDIKTLPVTLDVPPGFKVPAWDNPDGDEVKQVNVLKRFNSRKLPHLLEFVNLAGECKKYIYKQDDDISMDACVLKMMGFANKIWEEKGLRPRIHTYKVIACSDMTGFCEVVPGETMLKLHAKEMDEVLGMDMDKWQAFLNSIIAVAVLTCAFDITDRHHNNVMLSPDGKLVLIDLSASLGYKAPLDKNLKMNPVYLPDRIRKTGFKIRDKANTSDLQHEVAESFKTRRWSDIEEYMMTGYYALYNDRRLEKILEDVNYKMPKPHVFLGFLRDRKHLPQFKETLRNDIVETMDNNATVNKMVAAICSVVPMN